MDYKMIEEKFKEFLDKYLKFDNKKNTFEEKAINDKYEEIMYQIKTTPYLSERKRQAYIKKYKEAYYNKIESYNEHRCEEKNSLGQKIDIVELEKVETNTEEIRKYLVKYSRNEKEEYDFEVFGNMDINEMNKNAKYRQYIINNLMKLQNLKKISSDYSGYIGDTILNDDNEYKQKPNVEILKKHKELNKYKNQYIYNDKTITEVYNKINPVNKNKLKSPLLIENMKNSEVYDSEISIKRLKGNNIYKSVVLKTVLSKEWMDYAKENRDNDLGATEAIYVEDRMNFAKNIKEYIELASMPEFDELYQKVPKEDKDTLEKFAIGEKDRLNFLKKCTSNQKQKFINENYEKYESKYAYR